jgi:ACS family tartrate transporter-like MFS transporter
MFDPKELLLSLNYLGIVTASLGMLFFIPRSSNRSAIPAI